MIKVHNAGLACTDATPDVKLETFDTLVNTNIRAPYFLTQACLPYMPRGGRIILLSSIAARVPNPNVTNALYAMTKAANEAFARDWASEFGQSRGINVNGKLGNSLYWRHTMLTSCSRSPRSRRHGHS